MRTKTILTDGWEYAVCTPQGENLPAADSWQPVTMYGTWTPPPPKVPGLTAAPWP